ncbi:glycosyltransferase family 2 protein [uncultured Pontibacter sp.]|uniref:glycosyltransferase family 2 protein n=1 Tax=uncultured Pontibacter sp. TaxID=453356 RepID=UPI002625FAAC|nr:glycosyltransferase family 2 protein [uncultured Pontibacter sp.]
MLYLPKIYIILVNYNGWKDTIECLESLLQLRYTNKQILVVDNNSPNGSLAHMLDWAKNRYNGRPKGFELIAEKNITEASSGEAEMIFIEAAQNAGFAAGNNLAIRFALRQHDFEFLWLLNNDTVVDADSLSELVMSALSAIEKRENIGIWGSKLLFYHNRDKIQAIGGAFNLKTFTTSHIGENLPDREDIAIPNIKQDYVIGASMFVSKAFIENVGLLNEDYFLYFEELDWAKRGELQGYGLGYVENSKVYHKEGQSIGSSTNGASKSALADYHGIRSKILFVKRFYPSKLPLLYTLLTGSILLRIKRLQFKRALKIVSLMLKTS